MGVELGAGPEIEHCLLVAERCYEGVKNKKKTKTKTDRKLMF